MEFNIGDTACWRGLNRLERGTIEEIDEGLATMQLSSGKRVIVSLENLKTV